MSSHKPMRPDSMPLREALRGLRHVLRSGRRSLRDTMAMETLPGPAAGLARTVLDELGSLVRGVDGMASGLAKTVLGESVAGAANLRDFGRAQADAGFARAIYAALKAVLARLNAPGVFISEAAARTVFGQAFSQASTEAQSVSPAPTPTPSEAPEPSGIARLAAELTLALIEARVLRGTTGERQARVPAERIEAVAIFSVMLWLQADRSEDDNAAALDAAADLAVAMAADVARACAERDGPRLAALYERYAAHV